MLRIGALVLAYDKLSVIAATVILCALLYLFFNRTTLGTAMRASSENMLAAYPWAFRSSAWCRSSGRSRQRSRPAPTCCTSADHFHSFQRRAGAGPEGVSGRRARLRQIRRGGRRRADRGDQETLAGFYLPQGWSRPTSSCWWCCCSSPKACSAFTCGRRSRCGFCSRPTTRTTSG